MASLLFGHTSRVIGCAFSAFSLTPSVPGALALHRMGQRGESGSKFTGSVGCYHFLWALREVSWKNASPSTDVPVETWLKGRKVVTFPRGK